MAMYLVGPSALKKLDKADFLPVKVMIYVAVQVINGRLGFCSFFYICSRIHSAVSLDRAEEGRRNCKIVELSPAEMAALEKWT